MKIFKSALQLFFLVFCLAYSSDDYLTEYSDLKEGDTLKTLTDEKFDLHLYIFLDMNSCFVCQDMAPNLQNLLDQPDIKLEKIIFFSGTNKKSAEEYADSKNWNFEIITDYNNIYTNFYKIKRIPAYLILGKNGEVLNVDKLGGTKTTTMKLDSILRYARANKDKSDDRILSTIEILTEDNENIYSSHVRNIIYLEKTDEYLFNTDASDFIRRANNTGKIIETIYLDSVLKHLNMGAYNINDFVFNEVTQDLVMIMNSDDIKEKILHYNLKSKNIKIGPVDFIRNKIPNYKAGLDIEYSNLSDRYYLNLNYSDFYNKLATDKEPQLFKFNINGNIAVIEDTIKYLPSVRKSNDIWAFYYTFPLIIKDRLFTTNMLSSEVFEFDLNGNFKNKYGIYNSKYYRYSPKPMQSTDHNEYTYFRGRASINEALLFDKATHKIYIYFQNVLNVNEDNLILGKRIPTKHYLAEVTDDLNSVCNEYELPEDNVPFYINYGIVHTSTNEDGLKIYRLKIEKDN